MRLPIPTINNDPITPLINEVLEDSDFTKWGINSTSATTPDAWTSITQLWNDFILHYGAVGSWVFPNLGDDDEYFANNLSILEGILHKYMPNAFELYKTTTWEYNPIENYDRHELTTDTRTDDLTKDVDESTASDPDDPVTVTTTQTPTNWISESVNDPTGLQTTETRTPAGFTDTTKNAGYANSGATTETQKISRTFDTNESVTTSHSYPSGTPDSRKGDRTTQEQKGKYETEEKTEGKSVRDFTETNTGTVENVRESYIHGNIGVRSGQELVQQSRDLILNIEDWLVDKMGDAVDFRFNLPFYGG